MPPSVLFVDDEANVLHAIARRLRDEPYTVYTARSAQEALHIVKAHRVDVIVADVQMPGMCGTELLSWMADNLPDIPRIVLTGHADVSAVIRAVNDGRVFRFLTKPCATAELIGTIRLALEQRSVSGCPGPQDPPPPATEVPWSQPVSA
jgi:DNA-binding NtrC family response regulator